MMSTYPGCGVDSTQLFTLTACMYVSYFRVASAISNSIREVLLESVAIVLCSFRECWRYCPRISLSVAARLFRYVASLYESTELETRNTVPFDYSCTPSDTPKCETSEKESTSKKGHKVKSRKELKIKGDKGEKSENLDMQRIKRKISLCHIDPLIHPVPTRRDMQQNPGKGGRDT